MTEAERIAAVPELAPQLVEAVTAPKVPPLVLPGALGASLLPMQRLALATLYAYRSLVLQAACGDGKGLVTMLAPRVLGSRRALILVPAPLRDTFEAELEKFERLGFWLPDRSTFEVWSHAKISRHPFALADYEPDAIIVDEAHAFRNPESGRTRRLAAYLEGHPGLPLVFASGTLFSKSVRDVAHLVSWALGPHSPLPHPGRTELDAWAEVLDPDGRPNRFHFRRMAPFLERWGAGPLPSRVRQAQDFARAAFDARRRATPGLVVSEGGDVGATLVVEGLRVPQVPESVRAASVQAQAGLGLDGEPLEDPADVWRARQQIAIGVWYFREWPDGPDIDYLTARSRWSSAVRRELARAARPGYDTAGTIALAVEADEQHPLRAHWEAWSAVKDRYDFQSLTTWRWVDRFFVDWLTTFTLASKEPLLIWFGSRALGDALQESGIPTFGAGSTLPDKPITCAVSIHAHRAGKNLQDRWSRMIFAEPPPSGEAFEQAISRCHRPGQRADTVHVYVCQHAEVFRENFEKARHLARFIGQVQGKQRLQIATYKGVFK